MTGPNGSRSPLSTYCVSSVSDHETPRGAGSASRQSTGSESQDPSQGHKGPKWEKCLKPHLTPDWPCRPVPREETWAGTERGGVPTPQRPWLWVRCPHGHLGMSLMPSPLHPHHCPWGVTHLAETKRVFCNAGNVLFLCARYMWPGSIRTLFLIQVKLPLGLVASGWASTDPKPSSYSLLAQEKFWKYSETVEDTGLGPPARPPTPQHVGLPPVPSFLLSFLLFLPPSLSPFFLSKKHQFN